MNTESLWSRRGKGWLLLLSITGLLTGCGKAKQPWEKVYPVKGVVSYKGQPLAGARITLIPQNEEFPDTVRPTATSNEDGSFSVGTYSTADGAPAGEYKALVLRFPVVVTKDNAFSGPNNLPKKYAKVETTDLTVQIAAGKNELPPLELQ